MNAERLQGFLCPLEATLSIVGGKYKLLILYSLIDQTLRYSELQKRLPHASPKMLAQQLRELERDGLIVRTLYPTVPPRTEYHLTKLGAALTPTIISIYHWGERLYQIAGVENPCTEEQIDRLRSIEHRLVQEHKMVAEPDFQL